MKEITIISGKGGTGKTSITAAIASIVSDAVFCDNDVDAADLHLILHPTIKEEYTFSGGWTASIDESSCIDCGICVDHCRFDAIHINGHDKLEINPFKCEGCRLCERLCPVQAISSVKSDNNHWYVSDTRFGILVHARMGPGEENSGKLVSEVRRKAKELAIASHANYLINDGPPGIGCAAISSITGTDMVIMVIESSISGLHDARRLTELIETFSIPTCVLINKYDIDPISTEEIENFLEEKSISLLGKIPFDKRMIEAMVEGKTIVEFDDQLEISRIIENAWKKLESY